MNCKVLIVEDNANNLYLMEYLLKNSGYQIISAKDGIQGLALAQAEQPNLILMDIQMPDMDGFETTRQLKANPLTAAIPVIGVSSYAAENAIHTASQAGMVGYIAKPIIPEQFIEQIRGYLP